MDTFPARKPGLIVELSVCPPLFMSTDKSLPATSETDGDHLEASLQSHHSVTTLFSPVLSERLSARGRGAKRKNAAHHSDKLFILMLFIIWMKDCDFEFN